MRNHIGQPLPYRVVNSSLRIVPLWTIEGNYRTRAQATTVEFFRCVLHEPPCKALPTGHTAHHSGKEIRVLSIALGLLKVARSTFTSEFENIFVYETRNSHLYPVRTRTFDLMSFVGLGVSDAQSSIVV